MRVSRWFQTICFVLRTHLQHGTVRHKMHVCRRTASCPSSELAWWCQVTEQYKPAQLNFNAPLLHFDHVLMLLPCRMFGEWDVTAKFTTFSTPLGALFVDPSFLEAAQAPVEQGGMGSNTSYKMRLFSTLPDTWDNTVRARPSRCQVAVQLWPVSAAETTPGRLSCLAFLCCHLPDVRFQCLQGILNRCRVHPPILPYQSFHHLSTIGTLDSNVQRFTSGSPDLDRNLGCYKNENEPRHVV